MIRGGILIPNDSEAYKCTQCNNEYHEYYKKQLVAPGIKHFVNVTDANLSNDVGGHRWKRQ